MVGVECLDPGGVAGFGRVVEFRSRQARAEWFGQSVTPVGGQRGGRVGEVCSGQVPRQARE